MSLDTVPKLLPLWNGVTLKDCQGHGILKDGKVCSTVCLANSLFPDHSGAGVDFTFNGTDVECEELKSATNVCNYGSETFALPFSQPTKVCFHEDPCLGHLLRKKVKQSLFCRSLQKCRNSMKNCNYFRRYIFSSLEEMPDLIRRKKFKEVIVPHSVERLAKLLPKNFPVPLARWDYQGGCLATFTLNSSFFLLHPTGPKLSQLAISLLQEKPNSSKLIETHLQVKKISTEGGKILQIIEDSNSGVCCVRKKQKYQFINFSNNFEDMSCSLVIESFSSEEQLCDIKLSPYIPGEHIVALSSGLLYMENVTSRKKMWQLKEPLSHDSLVQDNYWWCDFGSHPRSVLYSDRQNFCSLDLRSKRPEAICIFSSPNPFLFEGEQLAIIKRFGDIPFQHIVATDSQLFICDERYPQQPVMSWSHMLTTVPLYCDIKPIRADFAHLEHVILLASQESAEIASFHVGCSSRVQPLSLSPPLHLSKPEDCAKLLEHDLKFAEAEVIARMTMPLAGVCAIPHICNDGYTVLQITSCGDIFYQQFQPSSDVTAEKTHRVEHGYVPIPQKHIPLQLSSWINCLIRNSKKKTKPNKQLKSHNIDLEKKFIDVFEYVPSFRCNMCKLIDQELPYEDFCGCCGLSVQFQKCLLDCAELGGVLCGNFNTDQDCSYSLPPDVLLNASKCTDAQSQMILSSWVDVNELHPKDLNHSQYMLSSVLGEDTQSSDLISAKHPEDQTVGKSIEQLVSCQQSYLDEDIIPPSQDVNPQVLIYSSRKSKMSINNKASMAF